LGCINSAPAAEGEFLILEPGQSFAVFLGDSITSGYHGRAVAVSQQLAKDSTRMVPRFAVKACNAVYVATNHSTWMATRWS